MKNFTEEINEMTENQLINLYDHIDLEMQNPSQLNNFKDNEKMKFEVHLLLITKFENYYNKRIN